MDMTPLQQFIDESQAKCSVHDFQLQFDPSEEGGSGWFSYFGLLTDGGSASDVLIRRTIVRGNYDEANEKQTALAEAVADRWNALPTALQYLGELSQQNEALTRRVAELEAELLKLADRHREDMSYHGGNHSSKLVSIAPNESLIPQEPKP